MGHDCPAEYFIENKAKRRKIETDFDIIFDSYQCTFLVGLYSSCMRGAKNNKINKTRKSGKDKKKIGRIASLSI